MQLVVPRRQSTKTFVDLLAYSPSEQEVNLSFSDQMMDGQYLFDNQDYLDWVVGLTTRDTFQNTVDAISGYHTMTGQWPDYSKIQEILSSYSAVPNNGSDGTLDQDGDGFSSRQEIVFRTSDSDPTDFQAVHLMSVLSSMILIEEGPQTSMDRCLYCDTTASGPDRFGLFPTKTAGILYENFLIDKYGRLPTLQQRDSGII